MLSKSVADCLKVFRECNIPSVAKLFIGSEATEDLARISNDCFDSANTRHPDDGITSLNWPKHRKV